MDVLVQKYGGSSVETIEKMQKVAGRVINRINDGYKMVIVLSAMGKTTNKLIDMAKSISEEPCIRELDMLVSTGEQVSISLLSMIFKEKGYDSISLTGFQAEILTEGIHTKNKISEIKIDKIKKYINQGKIVIIAGFQGINTVGDITTLGRGGSDTTAVALAAKLSCKCEIYTDVDGIYSIDPRTYAKSKKLDYLSYEEMMEMSSLGAKIMEARAVELASKFEVPLYVSSSHKEVVGTQVVGGDEIMEEKSIVGLSSTDNIIIITINNIIYSPNNVSYIFSRLADKDINIDMISQTSPRSGYIDIAFTIRKEDEKTIDNITDSLRAENKNIRIQKDTDVSKISAIGTGMRNEPGVASKVFKIFANNNIEFKQVTTSEISISYTIKTEDKIRTINAIAEEFNL